MRAVLRVIVMLCALSACTAEAAKVPKLAELPPPVRSYAEALKPYCEAVGHHEVVVNGIYSDRLFNLVDANKDGRRDYLVYKCMFGCDGDPYALQGLGPSCMYGSLLLSSEGGYRSIPVPGQLSAVRQMPQLRVEVYREHIHVGDCGSWYCNYVFELRDDWFRLLAPCPPAGCRTVLSAAAPVRQEQEAAAQTK